MSLPRCSSCGGIAHYAELRPSESHCHTVRFACRRCCRAGSGYPVNLADLSSVLPRLGDDRRTRRAAFLLATALMDASKLGRDRAAAAAAQRSRGLAA